MKGKTKVIGALASSAMVGLTLATVTPKVFASPKDADSPSTVVDNYFNYISNGMNDPSKADFGTFGRLTANAKSAERLEINAVRRVFADGGMDITGVTSDVRSLTQQAPNVYGADVIYSILWTLNGNHGESEFEVYHTVTVDSQNGQAHVADDQFNDTINGVTSQDLAGSQRNLSNLSVLKSSTSPSTVSPNTSANTYNPSAAVAYADQWAMSYNSSFPYFSGDDCANFVSQCLYEGGMPLQSYWTWNPMQPDWDIANDLDSWMKSDTTHWTYVGASTNSSLGTVSNIGDAIYAATSTGHMEIIDNISSTGVIYIDCHSSDAKDYPATYYNTGVSWWVYQPQNWEVCPCPTSVSQ